MTDSGAAEEEKKSRALAVAEVLSASSIAATTGALTGGPLGAVLGALSPAAVAGLKLLARRLAETEDEAVRVSGLGRSELAIRLLDDETRFSVAQQVFAGSQTAATQDKRLLLGRMLANAALASDVDIDEMLIHAQILVELEMPHIQVLHLLEMAERGEVATDPGTGGVTVSTLADKLPEVWLYSEAVLSRLQGHSLIEDAAIGTYGGLGSPGQSWRLSEFGKNFLRMLREEVPTDGAGPETAN